MRISSHRLQAAAIVGLTFAFSGAHVVPAMALAPSATSSHDAGTVEALQDLIRHADPYVEIVDGEYALNVESARTTLSEEQIAHANQLIEASNTVIRASTGEVTPDSVTDAPSMLPRAMFKEGVTRLEAHWYGFRVWLSKDTVRGIGGGVGVGALWIPEPIVSKVLASLGGAVAAFAPGGVVFNYTPVITPATPIGAFWGQEWQ